MLKGFFVTGTDTDCGKTEITLGLMHRLQQDGLQVLGMKPVAAGADETLQGLQNDDALRIQQQSSKRIPYQQVNPFVYAPSIAPHLAAEESGRPIEMETILATYSQLAAMCDCVIVEGAGGWRVPLNEELSISDLALTLKLHVILVVGMRLGCINHALLTVESIRQSGMELIGWVANHVDVDMLAQSGNLQTLGNRLNAPLLGEVPYLKQPSPDRISRYLMIDPLSE
jgi:dethiobiotin synthetase